MTDTEKLLDKRESQLIQLDEIVEELIPLFNNTVDKYTRDKLIEIHKIIQES